MVRKNSKSISRVLYPFGRLSLILSNVLPRPSSLPTLRLARATLRRRFTWNCSPQYTRFTSLVSVAVTKHYCLTAVNRCGALCCPDFPQPKGLSPLTEITAFFLSVAIDRLAMERHTGIEPASSAWEADALPMC